MNNNPTKEQIEGFTRVVNKLSLSLKESINDFVNGIEKINKKIIEMKILNNLRKL